MYRGTTPQIKLKLKNKNTGNYIAIDLDTVTEMWVTFKCLINEITKTLDDVTIINTEEEKSIIVDLTQEETLSLINGKTLVQIRFKVESGQVYATTIEEVPVKAILKEGVI